MLGGGFKSGHTLSRQDLMKAQRTRLINKALKQKGLPTLTATQKGKLNRGEITEKQLLKGAGLLGTLGSLGDSIFGLGEGGVEMGGFDNTMQYIAGGRARNSRKRMTGAGLFSSLANLAKKGVTHLANNPDLVNAGIGMLQNVLGKGGVEMGGDIGAENIFYGLMHPGAGGAKKGRGRPRRKMAGSGLLGTLGSLGDSIFGLGEGGVEMAGGFDNTMQYIAGGAKKGRGRPRKSTRGGDFADNVMFDLMNPLGSGAKKGRGRPRKSTRGGGTGMDLFDGLKSYGLGGAKKGRGRPRRKVVGSGLLGTLGSLGDSIFGLGEGEARKGRGRPRKSTRGGVSMGGRDMYFSGL